MDVLLKNMLMLIDSNYEKDEDFEKAFGITKSTVSAWRRGVLKSYTKYALAFADFFKVSLDELYGREDKKIKPLAEARGYNEKSIDLMKQIENLSPANQAKLSELICLFLASQDKN